LKYVSHYYILDGMTIQEIYDLALEMGMKADPRGMASVKKYLQKIKKRYDELPEKRKNYFDKEALTNPYSDTRIFAADPKKEVKKILAGIDANATEVLLADRLNEKGAKIDLLIGHHPEGYAFASLHEVMDLQVEVSAEAGIPIHLADALLRERMKDVEIGIHPINHNQTIDAAKLLGIPFMTLHTVWDNLGDHFMKQYLNNKEFDTVGEVMDAMLEIPEYQEAKRGKAGPIIVSGTGTSRAGKIAIFFTGGTNPSKEWYLELAKAGVGTIIDMHIREDALKELRKLHVNVINAGHMSSDSIGANLFFDELENKGIEILPCSGLIRVKRKVNK
jgi:putative NIF3 family GTP cyclohydrolase 1 type 2